MERGHGGLVSLAVGQLLLNIAHGAVSPLAEPRGELGGTVLAEVAVFKLAVAEQADLVVADTAVFRIK